MEKIQITDKILSELGFSEYHDEAGDFGSRRLAIQLPSGLWHTIAKVYCFDKTEEQAEGFGNEKFEYITTLDEIDFHLLTALDKIK